MVRNYLRLAWRNLVKHKFISFINLFGLAIGLTCCLLILAYILNELSYDRFQPYADRTYRVTRSFHNEQGVQYLHLASIAPPFGPALRTEFPEIEKMTRLLPNGSTAFRYEDKKFYERNVYFADEYLTDVFKVHVLKGNPHTALANPFSIMITDQVAKKYFGAQDPIDKLVRLDNNFVCKVAGVYEPFPANTHVHPDVLIAFNTLKDSAVYGEKNLETNWGNNSFFTYIVLPTHYNPSGMEARFPKLIDKYEHFPGEPPGFKGSKTSHLFLTPITDIHLRSHLDDEAEDNGDIKRVYIFSIIALFILLIACINYMNLSTARSVLRAREIGIRKTVGAERSELIIQFLNESVMLTWAASILALALTGLLMPWLNKMSGQELSLGVLVRPAVIVPLLVMPFVVGCIAGLYPAVFMSSFQPVKVLKGVFKAGGSISLRKVLVVLQFAISIILIICTSIVFRQLKYMQEKELGFNKDQVITMNNSAALGNRFESFRNELLRTGSVKNAALSSRIPSGRLLDEMDAAVPVGDSTQMVNANIKFVAVDYNFIPTYGIKIVAGRNFSHDFATDSSGFILNETAVSKLGWGNPSAAIHKQFVYGKVKGTIIGVMKDFHFESLHQGITPLIFLVIPNNLFSISVKLSGNVPEALSQVEKVWKQFLPDMPYDYTFVDDRFAKLYAAEQKQGTIFTAFACIAIFIACLGLFGLSAFTISQRIKEIGIRKVLGATAQSIVSLLSQDMLKLVLIAALMAFPIAWYAMHNWLQDFAYRINIPFWIFIVAGIAAAAIALLTISFQALKAARANPIKSLRTE